MQKRTCSFWDLIISNSWPKVQIIYNAPDHLTEIVRFYVANQDLSFELYSNTQLRDLNDRLIHIDLFDSPKLIILNGVFTNPQIESLSKIRQCLSDHDSLWIITSTKKLSLPWPSLSYTQPSITELQTLLDISQDQAGSLYELADRGDPLSILQLLQQHRLGLSLTQSASSPIEGSCWDLFIKLMQQEHNVDLSLEQLTQLSFAFEMFHQACSLNTFSDNFYFPMPLKKHLVEPKIRRFIDQDLLECYLKMLESILNGDKITAQYFTRLWIKSFAQQVH
ncbi:hypothetical protein EBS02_02520 [bacterium]|jgi:hypothetical protein|nr:hypothetical protein [bacterium]NBX71949.1 hypothetical protein [bacterium]